MDNPGFAKTSKLYELFAVHPEQRNDDWLNEFFSAIPEATLRFGTDEQVEFGPDGLPYAKLNLPIPGEPFAPVTLIELLPWITESGIGVVFNETDGTPSWVFPYGQLWSLRQFGTFVLPDPFADDAAPAAGGGDESEETEMIVGQPSEEALPAYVRQVIHRFIVDALGSKDEPQMVLLCASKPPRAMTLVFSIFPDQYPDEDRYRAVLQLMRWFLPTCYQVAGITRNSPVAENFQPLVVS